MYVCFVLFFRQFLKQSINQSINPFCTCGKVFFTYFSVLILLSHESGIWAFVFVCNCGCWRDGITFFDVHLCAFSGVLLQASCTLLNRFKWWFHTSWVFCNSFFEGTHWWCMFIMSDIVTVLPYLCAVCAVVEWENVYRYICDADAQTYNYCIRR